MHADPLALAQNLIRCRSVTPADDGALDALGDVLSALGFQIWRLDGGGTPNLFARLGESGPHLCFAGHTDVVPPGNAVWRHDPFGAEVRDGILYGRGACDMKGAIAAFVAAVAASCPLHAGSISLLITGDEEGPATHGTAHVVEWMRAHGQMPDFCLVGEPTNPARLGDAVKIGRRGSLNASLTIFGRQGHVAYPHQADNPVHRMLAALSALLAHRLDEGTAWFEPSSLQVVSIDVGNPTSNVIPEQARALLNIRFNDRHSGAALQDWLRSTVAGHAPRFALEARLSGEAFLTSPGPLLDTLCRAVESVTGRPPRRETGGGISDARFLAPFCPVVEFGLVGATMHQMDECVPVQDLHELTAIYRAVIAAFLPC